MVSGAPPKILIVGGGPVGLAAAICLGELGLACTVVERGQWPVDKVCGEGLLPSGCDFLKHHGLAQLLDDATPIRGIDLLSPMGARWARSRIAFAAGAIGAGLRRTTLSHGLWQRAQELGTVSLRPRTRVIDVSQAHSSAAVRLRRDVVDASCVRTGSDGQPIIGDVQRDDVVQADWVIAADGLRSTVRAKLRLPVQRLGKHERMGARQHYRLKHGFERVQVYWGDGYEFYVTPVGPTALQIACLYSRDYLVTHYPSLPTRSQELFATLLQKVPQLAAIDHASPTLSSFQAYGPLGRSVMSPVVGPVIFIGDAMRFWDGITGEGLSTGFRQAELVAECLATSTSASILAKRLWKTHRFNNLLTTVALGLAHRPKLRNALFSFIPRAVLPG